LLVGGALKTVGYAGLFGGVVIGFGGIIYTLFDELSSTSGSYAIIRQAVNVIEHDSTVMQALGPPGPLKIYGRSNSYGRRRPQVVSRFLDNGQRCLDTTFWVEGRKGRESAGLVTLQVVEEAPNVLKERFLAIDIPGQKRKVIIQPPPPPSSTFSFLSRLFGK